MTFAVGTDPDIATVNTQNRVSQATSQLPSEVTANGVTVQKASTNMLLVITLYSPNGTYDPVFLSNYASINLKDALARVQGVGRADVMTDFAYGMRIWLDPDRLTSLGMTPSRLHQRRSGPEHPGGSRPDWCAAGAGRPAVPVYDQGQGAPVDQGRVRADRPENR